MNFETKRRLSMAFEKKSSKVYARLIEIMEKLPAGPYKQDANATCIKSHYLDQLYTRLFLTGDKKDFHNIAMNELDLLENHGEILARQLTSP